MGICAQYEKFEKMTTLVNEKLARHREFKRSVMTPTSNRKMLKGLIRCLKPRKKLII